MIEIARRAVLAGGACLIGGGAAEETLATSFSFDSIDGGTLDFATLRGRVLLVVNTASFCGYTYQYRGLEALHAKREPDGLTVVGVPSQDFNQEKDSNGAVKAFCDATFGVRFPMSGIAHVVGPEAHPFYRWVRETRNWAPRWNFYKVLIGRDGRIAGLYTSDDEPDGALLADDLSRALSAAV